jgi:hypothetical protein
MTTLDLTTGRGHGDGSFTLTLPAEGVAAGHIAHGGGLWHRPWDRTVSAVLARAHPAFACARSCGVPTVVVPTASALAAEPDAASEHMRIVGIKN